MTNLSTPQYHGVGAVWYYGVLLHKQKKPAKWAFFFGAWMQTLLLVFKDLKPQSDCNRCKWHMHLTNRGHFDYRQNLGISNLSFMSESNLCILPIPKCLVKDDENIFTNYRPISVLPGFSKILERLVFNRCISFSCNYSILFESQFEFCPKHSTNMAINEIVDKIVNATNNNGLYSGMTFGTMLVRPNLWLAKIAFKQTRFKVFKRVV